MARTKIAILGAGIIARTGHVPAIVNNPDLQLAALYARTTKSSLKLISQFGLTGVDCYSEEENEFDVLLAREDITVYIVALPIMLQPPLIKKLLLAGKHVLSEKPIAENCKDARDLMAFYDALPVKPLWGVGENFRFKPSADAARDFIPTLGHISTFHVHDENYTGFDNVYFNTPWRIKPEHQGGFIMDGGLHNVAVLRHLICHTPEFAVSRVAAFANQNAEHLSPIDTLNATLVLRNGINGTYSGCYSAGIQRKDILVICEKGNVLVAPQSVVAKNKKGEVLFERTFQPDEPSAHAVTLELKAFVDGIPEGKLDPRLDPKEAYLDLHMLEQMIVSAKDNGMPKAITPA